MLEFQKMPGHLIRRLHQISVSVFASQAAGAGFDVTSVQFAALSAIEAYPAIDQAGLAGLIAYDRVTIGGVVDRLVQKGYVDRQVSPRDRRARELCHYQARRCCLASDRPDRARGAEARFCAGSAPQIGKALSRY